MNSSSRVRLCSQSSQLLSVCLFIYTISLIFSCVPCHFLKLTSLLLDLFNFFLSWRQCIFTFSFSLSQNKAQVFSCMFSERFPVCVSCLGFKEERRSVSWMVLTVCAEALGSRAGNPHRRACAPKEPPALVRPGKGHPISPEWIYVVLNTCEHVCHTRLGPRCGTEKTLSQPLTLQHLHLMSLWSTSALLQAGTADQEGCSGSLLHLRGLKGLLPMSIEWPQVHTYLLCGPHRLGPHSQSLGLLLLSEPWFVRHLGEPGIL